MKDEGEMSRRGLSTVLSSMNWFGGIFVSIVLLLLVAVPVAINIQGRAMHQGVKDFGAPATTAASDIQKALSHEVSGVIGLQESGEPRYAELYKQQRTLVLEKLSDLDRLGPNLGPSAELRLKDLSRSNREMARICGSVQSGDRSARTSRV